MTERPDFPGFIDSTARKDFVACDMLGYYRHFLHLRPKGQNIHLHFGGCLAKGLEMFRRSFYGKEESFDESLKAGAEAILLQWGDMVPPEKSKKTMSACVVSLYDYFIEYPPAEDPIKPWMFEGGPAVEFTFALPIPGTKHPQTSEPILYTGRFDMLAKYNDAAFVCDEKTATSLGMSWANGWRLASQITGYIWAAKQFGHSVQGAVIRGISPQARGIKHQMVIEQRADWMIDRWLAQLRRDIEKMIRSWETGLWDYNLDGSCASYGGCPYLPLCLSKNPMQGVETDYEVVIWDPLKET